MLRPEETAPGALPEGGEDYDVVIVGYGPCGALAASLLGKQGVRVLVVDREHEVYDKPRAMALDHEILRIFDNLGLADDVIPYIGPFATSQHFGAQGQLLRTLTMVPEPYPHGYTPSMVFNQPRIEERLRAVAESLESVVVELGTALISIAQSDRGVKVGLASEDGSRRTVSARYAIACDGASSTVRTLLGIELEDLDFDEPWIVVDMLVEEGGGRRLPEESAHFCYPERPIVYVVGTGNHVRWEIMLNDGEDPREMERPEQVWRLLDRWIGPDEASLWRSASYRFHALVARDWRRGRIFIAGDAAHQQPPILGQGMCQGMRDVANLAWKLGGVLQGRWPASILDSYQAERRPHVRELIERIKALGAVLCERDPEAARLRDERLLAEGGGSPRHITRQSILPRLMQGLLAVRGGPGVGTLFPQPWVLVGEGRARMDKVFGHDWRLIATDGRMLAGENTVARCRALGLRVLVLGGNVAGAEVVNEAEGVLAAWFDANRTGAAIVRPDHYVYGTAADPQQLEEIIGELEEALARAPDASPQMEIAREVC